MSNETISSQGIHIAGDFQSEAGFGGDWNPSTTPLSDGNGDDIFEVTVDIPHGTYQYKFINGNAWGMDESPPSDCSVGNFNNREVTINGDIVLPAVPFDGCMPTIRLAVNMTNTSVDPEGVYVMGNFQEAAGYGQNWEPSLTPLQDLNADGTYEIELALPPGNYQYLFVNGNTLANAESLPATCTVFGDNNTYNRIFMAGSNQDDPTVYCFNTCDACSPDLINNFNLHWWNDAVFYEIFVRSFYDSDGDGIGDFQGLIQKLDYLNDGDPNTHDDLGITGIWLMPMMESPSYHGYDVTDYYATEPDYGSMADFEAFLDAAHDRGIKVIIDLVLNHSSSQHPWFTQSASSSNGYRDWYIWEDTNPGFSGPWGQQIWHGNGGDYYYGLFWGGMPDLNYEHPPVKAEMFDVADFWLDKGVDGYRLDAIKYLIEDGTTLENTSATFSLLEEFNTVYKTNNPDAFTVGEVWSSTSSIIPYVQNDRLDVCFEFDLAGGIINAVNNGNASSIQQQLEVIKNAYPIAQYATFLTNHDIDRVFSQLGWHPDRMKVAASIYLSLPGIPFLYYGEEVGMIGTGDHENIRKPMQWTDGAHAGFTSGVPWNSVGSNYQNNNVASMESDPNSLLNHYKKMIRIRNDQTALRQGQLNLMSSTANSVISYARMLEEEGIIVIANLSSGDQSPTLNLEASVLTPGQYFLTDLYHEESLGTITVDNDGGISNLSLSNAPLSARMTRVLLLSEENPLSSFAVETTADLIELSPNPGSEFIQIVWKDPAYPKGKISVTSTMGQLMYETYNTDANLEINTSDWPNGIYFIQAIQNGERETIKWLKQ